MISELFKSPIVHTLPLILILCLLSLITYLLSLIFYYLNPLMASRIVTIQPAVK